MDRVGRQSQKIMFQIFLFHGEMGWGSARIDEKTCDLIRVLDRLYIVDQNPGMVQRELVSSFT